MSCEYVVHATLSFLPLIQLIWRHDSLSFLPLIQLICRACNVSCTHDMTRSCETRLTHESCLIWTSQLHETWLNRTWHGSFVLVLRLIYTWRDSIIQNVTHSYKTWLIHLWSKSHLHETWLGRTRHDSCVHAIRHDSCVHGIRVVFHARHIQMSFIHSMHATYNYSMHARKLIYIWRAWNKWHDSCGRTRHDSCVHGIREIRLIHTRHDSIIQDMTFSYKTWELFICEIRLI